MYFCLKAIAGPIFGFIIGKLTVLWLCNIFNDALTEITITLAATYLTFYVGKSKQPRNHSNNYKTLSCIFAVVASLVYNS